ncbi:tetraspanin-8-like [Astatotilapia calliptera]|uniref:Tetraspanin n=1 Tax=Astatotilapia calliptera TaxID=8154 RepID=A0A3P8PFU0_ASTCA|nr:tetraspanin-8-like [Astatotilapia calliptera]
MGKINGCLKCIFVFFNVLFAIVGFGLIYGLLQTSTHKEEFSSLDLPDMIWGWLFAIGVLGISSLGIFATCCESIIGLKLFASFMGIGMIIMFYGGINVATGRNEIETALQNELQKANIREEVIRSMVEKIQSNFHCCGIRNATDWGNNIPDSCECISSNTGSAMNGRSNSLRCKSKPQGTSGPHEIYEQPCYDIILELLNLFFNILFGFFFGFAVIALLGLLITICMINQVKSDDSRGSMYLRKY